MQTADQAMATNKLHQGVLQGKVNACMRLEGTTSSHAGSLGRPGEEGFRGGQGAQSLERKAPAPGQLRAELRSCQHIPGQWGAAHRKVTTPRRLYIISRRATRHLRGTLGAAPESCRTGTDSLGTLVGNPDCGDREPAGARDRELGTGSQDEGVGRDSEWGEEAGMSRQGAGSGRGAQAETGSRSRAAA